EGGEGVGKDAEEDREEDPGVGVAVADVVDQPEPDRKSQQESGSDERYSEADQAIEGRNLARRPVLQDRREVEGSGDDDASDEEERARDVEEQQPLVKAHGSGP